MSGADPASVPVRPSAGCGADPATAVVPGEQRVTITSSGVERWFFERVPPAHDGQQPLPLVLDFHGYSEGAEIHLLMSALGPFGDERGFVTLTPQGTGPVPRWDTTLGSPDLVFVGDLLDHAETTLCIDTNRVFATGLSNGAFMSSAIACAYADRVAAVAPVAGIRDVNGCAQERPVPVVAFHGTADGFVAYDGGLGERALDLPAPDGSGRTLREAGVEPSAGEADPVGAGHRPVVGSPQRLHGGRARNRRERRCRAPHVRMPCRRRGRALPRRRWRPLVAGQRLLRPGRLGHRADDVLDRRQRAHVGVLHGASAPGVVTGRRLLF